MSEADSLLMAVYNWLMQCPILEPDAQQHLENIEKYLIDVKLIDGENYLTNGGE